ncbi:MAG TPA: hypothetical protein VNO30_42680 [Kofleriaceae bacterium]|nr:hypothetical protein [Kofleriaceae bacterium]
MLDYGGNMTRWLALMLCVAACGNVSREQEDAGVRDDAKVVDAAVNNGPMDAPTVAPPPHESREIVTGGVRMQGSTYMFDVQVGHPYQQSKATGSTYTFEGNAAVKP